MVDRTDRLRPIKKSQMRPANRNGQTHDIRAEGEMIVIRLRAGDFFTVACGRAGVPMRTAREWLLSGKGGLGTVRHAHLCREEHVWFYEEVMLALAEVEGSAVDAWMGEIKQGNWQAARDFLARRFPKRWGPGEHRE